MEVRLFPEGQPPEWTTFSWYSQRQTAPHLEQPGHRERLLHTAHVINDILNPDSVVDLGAGDGGLLSILNAPEKHGYDLQMSNVEAAKGRNQRVYLMDVVRELSTALMHKPDVVVATEILEHLVYPHEFVRNIYAGLFPGSYLVASSPWHETETDHYEFHTWAWDFEGYRTLLEGAGFVVTSHEAEGSAQIIVGRK